MARTYYLWDPLSDNIMQEWDNVGGQLVTYTTEPGRHGNVIAQNRDGVASYFHCDILGSILAITSEVQQVTDRLAYTAFGVTTESDGSDHTPLRYVGQHGYRFDALTEQYAVRRRSYSTDAVRWISPDLLRLRGTNPYIYARNSPSALTDPSGEAPFCAADEECSEVHCGVIFHSSKPVSIEGWKLNTYVFEGECPGRLEFTFEYGRERLRLIIDTGIISQICKTVTQRELEAEFSELGWPMPKCPAGKRCTNLKQKGAGQVIHDNKEYGDLSVEFYYRVVVLDTEYSDKPFTPGQKPCKVTVRATKAIVTANMHYGKCVDADS